MELFDLLERRISELLKEIALLKEENSALKLNSVGILELREENQALKESLEFEQSVQANINSRVDVLLTMINEHIM